MRSQDARKQLSATDARNLRRLLLLNVFEPEEIGERIAQARERAGLRQEDLADLIGMSTRQVQNYEAGDSKQYGKLKAIAGATGSTVEWLLHGDEVTDEAGEMAGVRDRLEALEAKVDDGFDRIAVALEALTDRLDERADDPAVRTKGR